MKILFFVLGLMIGHVLIVLISLVIKLIQHIRFKLWEKETIKYIEMLFVNSLRYRLAEVQCKIDRYHKDAMLELRKIYSHNTVCEINLLSGAVIPDVCVCGGHSRIKKQIIYSHRYKSFLPTEHMYCEKCGARTKDFVSGKVTRNEISLAWNEIQKSFSFSLQREGQQNE